MTFYTLLILLSIFLFLISGLLLIYNRGSLDGPYIKIPLLDSKIYYLAFLSLSLLTYYYLAYGIRPYIWFGVFSIYFVLSIINQSSQKQSHHNFVTYSVLFISILITIIPIFQNNGIIFGPDQWRDLKITTQIIENGNFKDVGTSGYYSFLPLFNVINTVLTQITGWQPMNTFVIMQAVYSIISILGVYHIVELVSGRRDASIIAIAIFLSTPRLSTVQSIPAVASISMGIFLVFFMIEIKPALLYLVPFISFTTTVIHPIGIIPVTLAILGILFIGSIFPSYKLGPKNESYLSLILTICIFVTIFYWSIDSKVLTGVFSPLKRLINILTNLEYTPSVYTPQYTSQGFLIYAYSWAFPVSITAIYFLNFLINERKTPKAEDRLKITYGISTSTLALVMVMLSFFSLILSPGASLERYINVPAYLLMVFPSTLIIGKLLGSGDKMTLTIIILLLSTNIIIGTSSPNWAPFENPAFGSYRSSYLGYQESRYIINTLPEGIRIYEDNDIPLYELADLENLNITKDQSYQTIRDVIQDFKTNEIDLDNSRLQRSIVYLKTVEIEDNELYNNINVLYNNGFHSGLRIYKK